MKRNVDRLEFRLEDGQVVIIAKARSGRGTRFTHKRKVVVNRGLSDTQRKNAMRIALAEFLPPEPTIE